MTSILEKTNLKRFRHFNNNPFVYLNHNTPMILFVAVKFISSSALDKNCLQNNDHTDLKKMSNAMCVLL